MTGHRIELSLETDSGVSANFVCEEPSDGWCHKSCDWGCEIFTDDCIAHHPRCQHEYCNPIEFVNNCGEWWEQYIGEETEPRSGSIVFEWQGPDEFYGWRYENIAPPLTPTTATDEQWVDPFQYENVRASSTWWYRIVSAFRDAAPSKPHN